MALKVLISGGGTGGHIFPAVAIANALVKRDPTTEILFVGAEGKMEMDKVPQAGYKIIGLPIAGLSRKLDLNLLKFPIKLVKSLFKAGQVVRGFKPDVAIGVGGYASGPTLLWAGLSGVPTLIQEQNSFAGITNKFLGKKAQKICVAYEGMERFFPAEKIEFTGNPVRSDILNIEGLKPKALEHFGLKTELKTLLVIGGSQGALSINKAIGAGLERLTSAGLQVLWQTGSPYYTTAQNQAKAYEQVHPKDFIKEMNLAYAAADLVVSRSGASSISELCLVQKPAVLVPFPLAAEDHQTHNAQSLVKVNAAQMVADSAAAESLITEVLALLADEPRRQAFQQNLKPLAKPQAAEQIVDQIYKITQK